MTLYLGMGWLILIALPATHAANVPIPSLAWLVAGGIAYTGGVFFFVSKRSRYTPFRLAFICPRRHGLPFPRRPFLRHRMNILPNETLPVEHTIRSTPASSPFPRTKSPGFVREPFAEIADARGVCRSRPWLERIVAMLRAGTSGASVRRCSQPIWPTAASSPGKCRRKKIDAAFRLDVRSSDPFSGHVVLRSTDAVTPGSDYKLWTTLKVPHGFSLQRHGEISPGLSARAFRLMPAKGSSLSASGHVRRKTIEAGNQADAPGIDRRRARRTLTEEGMDLLTALKPEIAPEEIFGDAAGIARAEEAGVSPRNFVPFAEE
jgi:hypothetical protein